MSDRTGWTVLNAMLVAQKPPKWRPTVQRLARELAWEPAEVEAALSELERTGDVSVSDWGFHESPRVKSYSVTPKGRRTAAAEME